MTWTRYLQDDTHAINNGKITDMQCTYYRIHMYVQLVRWQFATINYYDTALIADVIWICTPDT